MAARKAAARAEVAAHERAAGDRQRVARAVQNAISIGEIVSVGVVNLVRSTLVTALAGARDVGAELGTAATAAVRGSIRAAAEIGGDLGVVAKQAVKGTVQAAQEIGGDLGSVARSTTRGAVKTADELGGDSAKWPAGRSRAPSRQGATRRRRGRPRPERRRGRHRGGRPHRRRGGPHRARDVVHRRGRCALAGGTRPAAAGTLVRQGSGDQRGSPPRRRPAEPSAPAPPALAPLVRRPRVSPEGGAATAERHLIPARHGGDGRPESLGLRQARSLLEASRAATL